jgi:mannose-1-phosphate guanylyltransferase
MDLSTVIAFHRERVRRRRSSLRLSITKRYGLVETESDGRVRRFLEKPKAEEITCNTINAASTTRA